jgi:hypothetical protein
MPDYPSRCAAFDRFSYFYPLGALSVSPVTDLHFDTRSFSDTRESESADDGEFFWVDLGGEG